MESASQLTWKIKAANGVRILKSKLNPQGQDEKEISPYVRLYFLGVSGVVALLSLICIFFSFLVAIFGFVAASTIAVIELIYLFPKLVEKLQPILNNFVWRAIIYALLAIPLFFSFVTFLGAILILVGCLAYAYCIYKGEKPVPVKKVIGEDGSEYYRQEGFNEGNEGLLSDYQRV